MKFNKWKYFTLAQLLLIVAIIGLLAAFMQPAQAQGLVALNYPKGSPTFFTADTNAASFALTNNQTQTLTAGGTNTLIKTLRQGKGLSLFLTVWQTNSVASTTTNYTVGFDVFGNASTWTRGNGATPFTWAGAARRCRRQHEHVLDQPAAIRAGQYQRDPGDEDQHDRQQQHIRATELFAVRPISPCGRPSTKTSIEK